MNGRDLDTNMSGRGRGKRAAVKNVVDPTEEDKPVKKISKKKQFLKVVLGWMSRQ